MIAGDAGGVTVDGLGGIGNEAANQSYGMLRRRTFGEQAGRCAAQGKGYAVDDPVGEGTLGEVEVERVVAFAVAGGLVVVNCEVKIVDGTGLEGDWGEEVGQAGCCGIGDVNEGFEPGGCW